MITKVRIFGALVFTLLTLLLIVLCSYFYSAFIEQPYLSYKQMPFLVTGPVFAGGPASAHVIRCNTSGVTKSYTTTRGFQKMGANALPILLPSLDLTVEPGCEPATSRINIVPDNTLPGWYRFVGTASVRGLMSWHEIQWSTTFFEVVARPSKESEIIIHSDSKDIKVEVLPE